LNSEPRELTLSVVIPVYNERYLVRELLRRVLAVEVPGIADIEVVVVDDGSRDGTRELLREVAAGEPRIRYFEHAENGGKGAALRTGIREATGELIVFQDADLEYDPRDYVRLVRPFLEDGADVVYGSRFLPGERRRVLYFRHTLGNRLLTFLSNWFTDLNLTDMETCYKMFRAALLKSIPIRSHDFAIEPEITAKVAKRGSRVFEVPISYVGRTYGEGKKIGWRDGFKALGAILKYWLVDDLYAEDQYGSHILHRLERVQRFNRWMAQAVAPDVGSQVLEIGAGIGNVTHALLPRDFYLASDVNPHYVDYLSNFAVGKPYLQVDRIDLEDGATFAPWAGKFDTVICLNVLEHVRDPLLALRNMHGALEPGGKLVLYVPQGPALFSSLDEVLGHRCRYTKESLRRELEATGFEVQSLRDFNRLGVGGWWLNGKILRRRNFSRIQLKIFDLLVPLLRRIDAGLPGPGLGILAVARKAGS
jgi:2-polyprenyl-3-methyl-5-hydroxy-6-metoxy-1,4-benzoquinol methylase